MGKVKGHKGAEKNAPQAPKCTCDDPYRCFCGKRPERPSKGHRWDSETQQWGGKGHKQKGASGQIASKAVEAQRTEIGKTIVAQWQRLPTTLLLEITKREGRPAPKYVSMGKFRFRVIIQDAKASKRGSEHDLVFFPAQACENEEQAKEEAALLALLHLTPNIPHERKLPEPYKTTWIHTLSAVKDASKNSQADFKDTETGKSRASISTHTTESSNSDQGAKASTNLSQGSSFVSVAERRRAQDSVRQERNARIRHHEAVRMANQDHQVFLSAAMRKRIEALLRGDTVPWDEDSKDDALDGDEFDSDLKAYVIQRLESEGFSKREARTSFSQCRTNKLDVADEDMWDVIYEECLQWLCIHLDEDQLPEGFDPRGRTLDVIVNKSLSMASKLHSDGVSEAHHIASKYGVTAEEAARLIVLAENGSMEQVLWKLFCSKAPIALTSKCVLAETAKNLEIARDEFQALEAIFSADECQIDRHDDVTILTFSMHVDEIASKLQMKILIRNGLYPAIHVDQVIIYGSWSKPLATAVHVQLIQFISELPLTEPMIYEIFGYAQDLLRSVDDGVVQPLPLPLSSIEKVNHSKPRETVTQTQKPVSSSFGRIRRPRERESFWTTWPEKTPKAFAFPKTNPTIRRQRESLPATAARQDFLDAMEASLSTGRVVLVTGDTGCGKTTQIPQFILEEAPGEAKIVVAQPRRLAATGVASRVANERGESQPGTGSVGYVVRGDVAMSANTRLLFCTTGVLLRQLQSEGAFDGITHIVVDEVHERQLDSDILLGLLKNCLERTPRLRVVLMSATLDADRFAAYWGPKTPRIHIPGRTFPVVDFMLEDVLALTGYIPPKKRNVPSRSGAFQDQSRVSHSDESESIDDPSQDGDTVESSRHCTDSTASGGYDKSRNMIPLKNLIQRIDQTSVDYNLLAQLIKALMISKKDDGSILVFLPGAPEIKRAIDAIQKVTRGIAIDLLPLHGGLQPKDQSRVFIPASPGRTKVIISTNIAETSITIPDCTIVVDSCREKQSSYDPINRMPLLVERFAAKANLKQRRGRAGRVRAGTCYKLVSRDTYEGLEDFGTPEIHRCPLDQTLLSLLFLGVEDGSGIFLQTLLDSPSQANVDTAICSLKKLGAVSQVEKGRQVSLTPLGMHLAGIPAPPTVAKLLIMGSILGCRSAALAMAAGMSLGRSPFIRIDRFPTRDNGKEESIEELKRMRTLEARDQLFKSVGNSDHAMVAGAYLHWDSLEGHERRSYCELIGLTMHGAQDLKQLVKQFDSALASSGYDSTEESDRNSKSWKIIRSCIVAALAPSQMVRVHRPCTRYVETFGGAREKDGEAKELRFFIRALGDSSEAPNHVQSQVSNGASAHRYHGVLENRVFIHPSSANFATGTYSCPWLVYHEMVQTSKAFLRDCTECSAYALLLFGGKLEVQASKGIIVMEDWARLAANARIGALIGGLRKTIDDMLTRKVQDPRFDIASTEEMRLVRNLLLTDGFGQ